MLKTGNTSTAGNTPVTGH